MSRFAAALFTITAFALRAQAHCPDYVRTNYAVTGSPRAIATADFNRDGKLDLLVGINDSSGKLVLFPGNGDGTFAAPTDINVAGLGIPFVWSMVVSDFNGDGKPDVAVTNEATVLLILLGNGDGTFTASRFTVSEADDLFDLTAADFNGDGMSDLAMLSSNVNKVSIRFGQGNGTFGPATLYAIGLVSRGIVAADLNGDGKVDLAVSSLGSNAVSVLLNNGNGTFATSPYSVNGAPSTIAAADFNHDGKPDLAMGIIITAAVLLNNGNGTFAPGVQYATGISPTAIATDDFDRDGNADIVTANQSSASISLLLGNGNGTFRAPIHHAVGTTPWGIAIGDFTRRGRASLAIANFGSNNVSVLLDRCVSPRRRAARH